MRSVGSAATGPAPSDATARARIRDAAIELFGRDGYAAASVRAIAEAGGASPALVLHHFGSKEGLRRACDEHVVAELFGMNSRVLADGASDDTATLRRTIGELLAHAAQLRPMIDYLGRMLVDPGPTADALFDALVEQSADMIRAGVADGQMHEPGDLDVTALLVTLHGLSNLVLQRQVARRLGGELLSPAVIARLTLPTLELYTRGLYADERVLDAARAALADPTRADRHPTDPQSTDERTPGP
ncbi:MAG: TetR family transcriptional regulator [Actinomycetales bacterium]|nr:TetR family transcriptional regulator [Actinomycetales bacterium]